MRTPRSLYLCRIGRSFLLLLLAGGEVCGSSVSPACLLPAPRAESAELCREGQQNRSPVSGFPIRLLPCLLTPSSLSFPGKHAIPNLVKNLPGGQQTPAKNLSEDTVVSILNTINEVIVDNLEAAKKLRETQGIEKLVLINKSGYILLKGCCQGWRGLHFLQFSKHLFLRLFLGTAQREKSGQPPSSCRQSGAIRNFGNPLRKKAGRSQISRCGDALW